MGRLHRLKVRNFLSLREVDLELGDLNVLVGPNGAGKSNLLRVLRFLANVVRWDLRDAVRLETGGITGLLFRGVARESGKSVGIDVEVSRHGPRGGTARDAYTLRVWRVKGGGIHRYERLRLGASGTTDRTIEIRGTRAVSTGRLFAEEADLRLAADSSGLRNLRQLSDFPGASGIAHLAETFASVRWFEPDVALMRKPSSGENPDQLNPDASDLADFLFSLGASSQESPERREALDLLTGDLHRILGSRAVRPLVMTYPEGRAPRTLAFAEAPLHGFTQAGDASFGTRRALALLAMLHDPNPPPLTCVDDIDMGLHPYALDIIVERMRAASRRTQLIVTTHSPALVNRLQPEELVVCERDWDTGASRIPAVSREMIRTIYDEERRDDAAYGLGLGELWFTGTLGGVVQ